MVSVPCVPYSTDHTKLKRLDDGWYEQYVPLPLGSHHKTTSRQFYRLTLKSAAYLERGKVESLGLSWN